ncbi:hypothetical protein [Clostridium sp. UBA6640]|uniref:hypothetical protein n=1 Tax=Clostridium sp. UBA6640 TaxID=1946370 RepID=UPI0025BD6334|nr:hypothetical protein [Clostridium sp. UBA6640]
MRRKNTIILFIILIFSFNIFQVYSNTVIKLCFRDLWLENHKYLNPIDSSENIYIIIDNKGLLKFHQYNINNDDSINITIPKSSKFIISLYENSTITAKWDIINELNPNVIKFIEYKKINPFEINPKKREGQSNSRKFMYFQLGNEGEGIINLGYKHIDENEDNYYTKVRLNIKIN